MLLGRKGTKFELSAYINYMDTNIKSLEIIAERLTPMIYFRFLTCEWNEVINGPVVKLWTKKPIYKHGYSDYGYEWEGWQSTYGLGFICMFAMNYFIADSLSVPSKDTNWSKLIVNKEEIKHED